MKAFSSLLNSSLLLLAGRAKGFQVVSRSLRSKLVQMRSASEQISITEATLLTGVRDIIDNYDTFLLDMW